MVIPESSRIKEKAYLYANGQILASYDGQNKYYYLHDRLGSVRQMMDRNGVVAAMYTYNPFGEELAAETIEGIENSFRFTGQYYDSETGQYYLRARQYSPYLACFTTRDLVTGKFEDPLSLHKYLYCQNEPVTRTDPLGLWYVDLNYSWSYGTGNGALRGGWGGALAGSISVTAGAMLGTKRDGSVGDYYYFGGGLNFSAFGGHTLMATASPQDISTGWNFALTAITPGGQVAQAGWSGIDPRKSPWFFEGGVKLARSAKLPANLPKYLQGLDPKQLLENSFPKPSNLNPRDWLTNAQVSFTGFYVFDQNVFAGNWTDTAFAAGEMFAEKPSILGINPLNVMFSELLDFDGFAQ